MADIAVIPIGINTKQNMPRCIIIKLLEINRVIILKSDRRGEVIWHLIEKYNIAKMLIENGCQENTVCWIAPLASPKQYGAGQGKFRKHMGEHRIINYLWEIKILVGETVILGT